ncbi:dual specificity phosphatase [Nitzschia inconspicua]|uniref:protein-tyrosine-phosphatase n=1 Tax=Nitzschia inconspicua TaxID=303405 RepID=A0A9K3L507_9STRA|nr:dual specificity phosphatase [Nitzschia inconspicua]
MWNGCCTECMLHEKEKENRSIQQQQEYRCCFSSTPLVHLLGSKDDAKNLDLLQKRTISHILNVTPTKADVKGGVPNYFEKLGTFTYLRIPLFDDATSVQELQTKYSDTILDFIHRGLYHGNVLVHCHYGISRSTTCVALYLMSKRNMSLDEAMTMIQRRRPQAQPIPAFMEFLKRKDIELLKQRGHLTNNNDNKKRPQPGATVVGPLPPPTVDDEMPVDKKRVLVGPAVPVPTPPTSQSCIGPSLPPSMVEPTVTTNEKASTIGPALPPKSSMILSSSTSPPIGPSLPPKEGDKDIDVGPAFPP